MLGVYSWYECTKKKLIFPNIDLTFTLTLDAIEALCSNTLIYIYIYNFMMLHHWLASINGI
jgi:hypothetical protein